MHDSKKITAARGRDGVSAVVRDSLRQKLAWLKVIES